MPLPQASAEFYRDQQAITLEVLQAASDIWGTRPPRDFDSWFAANVDRLTELATMGQLAAAAPASQYVDDTVDELGFDAPVLADIEAGALSGVASDGRPLDSLMYGAVITSKGHIAQAEGTGIAATVAELAWESGRSALLMRMQTQVADASRVATGLRITSRTGLGYVRMLNPPSCSRCAVLAGGWYPFSSGFLRHPLCDCRHVAAPKENSLPVYDAGAYFDSLDERMQNKVFTRAGADAIRSGADINQVVNARRGANGLDTAGRIQKRNVYGRQIITTTEGTTKRGFAGKIIRARGRNPATTPRLMPEDIYEITDNREDALRLLETNGYVIDRTTAVRPGSRRLTAGRVPRSIDLDRIPVPPPVVPVRTPLDIVKDAVADARKNLPTRWDTVQGVTVDTNGSYVPTAELKAHLDTVVATGRLVRLELERRVAFDVDVIELRAKRDEAAAAFEKIDTEFDEANAANAKITAAIAAGGRRRALKPIPPIGELYTAQLALKDVTKQLAAIESRQVREALSDIRQLGGHQQATFSPTATELGTLGLRAVDADALTVLREAEKFYPTEWLIAADKRGPLGLGYTPRGFFAEKFPGRVSRDVIAFDDRNNSSSYVKYDGAHSDVETEVMIHEIGHRMEKAIPGLTQLQFALARTRAIDSDGVLEHLKPIFTSTARADEVAYKDEWKNAYAGKSYSPPSDIRPDMRPHEVFQTGTQDLFGRSTNRYGDENLQEFMMGVLALL